jgi:hypothetical protein
MTKRLLALFNERVDRLLRSALAKRMRNPRYVFSYEKMMNREWICADGVSEDAIDAFVLNVRLLVQDNDGFSIRRLAEDVYTGETVPLELKERFATARGEWREHMDQYTPFKHPCREGNFTNQELFEVLMYGGLAHANPDKVDMFFTLTKRGAVSTFVFGQFLISLHLLLKVVCAIRDVNEELLCKLRDTTPIS